MSLTKTTAWQTLKRHQDSIANLSIREPAPVHREINASGLRLNYTQHLITDETLPLLMALAEQSAKLQLTGLPQDFAANDSHSSALMSLIKATMTGAKINKTEGRAVLHTALRSSDRQPLDVGGVDIRTDIVKTHQKMAALCEDIYAGKLTGATGKQFKSIVNIGIGGSHTGPLMTTEALKDYAINDLAFYFVSTIDPALLSDVLNNIEADTTLFIVSSKSFSTIETKTNAEHVRQWLTRQLGKEAVSHHMIGITANSERAVAFGLDREKLLPMWDWVGGRYSIWSAIGLPLMLMIGPEQFHHFLSGAEEMDQHTLTTPLSQNMPAIMAMLSIWYTNFYGTTNQAIIPYSYRLRSLITYFQQAIMESNGKSVSQTGDALDYNTSSVIFGQEGCEGQHTYHQMLHQGTQLIPVDMILIHEPFNADNQPAQDILLASALSQAEALRIGKLPHSGSKVNKPLQEITTNSEHLPEPWLSQHQAIPGNRPVNLISMQKLTPKTLGNLLALYEHIIHIQGIIWNIYPFDQWGVELGKTLLPTMLDKINQTRDENI